METTAKDLLRQLEELGTAQNRKVYRRHGVTDEQFGVAYGKLRPMAKKIKVNHAAALALWASGNHDARVLASMIADPQAADEALLDAWASDLNNYVLTDAFSAYVVKTPLARRKLDAWTHSENEWLSSAGWTLLTTLADVEGAVSDPDCRGFLERIEEGIQTAPNRTRYAMNYALIAIGARGGELRDLAVAAAERIGKVEVDHGETGCKTPEAVGYITKTLAYREKKAAERAAKSKAKAGKK